MIEERYYQTFGRPSEAHKRRLEDIRELERINGRAGILDLDNSYNGSDIVGNAVGGAVRGVVTGFFEGLMSAYAIPTGLRKIKDRFPNNVLDIVSPLRSVEERVHNASQHLTRLPIRLATMGFVAYEGLFRDGVDPWMVTLNVLSLGYELYRSGRHKE